MSSYIAPFFSNTSVAENSTFSFKNKYDMHQRKSEYTKISSKYPDSVIIILENPKTPKHSKDKILKRICKYDMSMGQLRYYIRRKIGLSDSQSIVFFINNIIPGSDELVGVYNDKYQDDDGFLYITYTLEETFG